MYHSIKFSDLNGRNAINTWDDWFLIPSERFHVSNPTPAFKYVDVPGRDGSLDLTDYLVGRPTYSDCSGTFDFIVDNDHGNWIDRKRALAEYLDGRERKMWLIDDDPGYYYVGRFYLAGWKTGQTNSTVSIQYRVRPYKYNNSTGEKVLA